MPLLPSSVISVPIIQFADQEGAPLAAGKLYSYEAGTDTPAPLYTDVDLTIPYDNPIILDTAGTAGGPIYWLPQGYKFVITDSNDVVIETADDIEDVGYTFASIFGTVMTGGSKDVVSGYTVTATDLLITVDSTGGDSPCVVQLPAVADRLQPLCIKNLGTEPLAVTPDGTDLIENGNVVFTVPAVTATAFPTIWLYPDPDNQSWWVTASYGL